MSLPDQNTRDFFVYKDGKHLGPYTRKDLLKNVELGYFNPEDLTWYHKEQSWQPIQNFISSQNNITSNNISPTNIAISSPSINEIWILKDGQQYGPYTKDILLQYVSSGHFSKNDLIWHKNINQWQPFYSHFNVNEPKLIQADIYIEEPQYDINEYRKLRRIAFWLDDLISIPGTQIRFGIDPLLGITGIFPPLFPIDVALDVFCGFLSLYFVYKSSKMGIPNKVIWQMLFNVIIDTGISAVPTLGEGIDIVWKANSRNLDLLERTLNIKNDDF